MRNCLAVTVFFFIAANSRASAEPMTFEQVWSQVISDPYTVLPEQPTMLTSFTKGGIDLLRHRASETLRDERDITPYFQKLVHPIGICFAGTWEITKANRYSGYFARGSRARIIVRASEALGQPRAGAYRSFGFAGKIFPNDEESRAANFYTVDDLGGTLADLYMQDLKLNQPKTSMRLSSVWLLPMIAKIAKTFSRADSNAGIRQVYQISELGLQDPSRAVTPKWMAIQPESKPNFRHQDFRRELSLRNNPAGLKFGVLVADENDTQWQRVGQITLTQDALTESCDHRLHFQHPRSK